MHRLPPVWTVYFITPMRPRGRSKYHVLMRHLTVLIILSVAATLGGCVTKGGSVNSENDVQSFPVVRLAATDTVLHHHYVADIQAVRNVEVRARINGFLNKIYVDEGQLV